MTDRTAASHAAELGASLDALAAARARRAPIVPEDKLEGFYRWLHKHRHPASIRGVGEQAARTLDEQVHERTEEALLKAKLKAKLR